MSKFLFISVKPEYANKIIDGEKTIELRKIKPNVSPGDLLLIYATVPVKAVIGYGKINSIISSTPKALWDKYSNCLGVDQDFFNAYYSAMHKAVGIEISSVTKFEQPITLSQIRGIYPKFSPPQTYRYFTRFQAFKVTRSIFGDQFELK